MKKEFILISKSPRRRKLLKKAGFNFKKTYVDTDEQLNPNLSPEKNAIEIAKSKILVYLKEKPKVRLPLVAADTIVVTDQNEILGKPKDRTQAIEFIKKIQGTHHTVITGVYVYIPEKSSGIAVKDAEIKSYVDHLSNGLTLDIAEDLHNNFAFGFASKTKVHIYKIPDKEIEYYVDTFKPYDKAGAYGVQDWFGLRYIHKIEGCYYNVVGFPVATFQNIFEFFKSCEADELFPL